MATSSQAPSRLASLPWSKLPAHRLRGSVWDSMGQGETISVALSIAQLEESFAVQETPSRTSTSSTSRRRSSAGHGRPRQAHHAPRAQALTLALALALALTLALALALVLILTLTRPCAHSPAAAYPRRSPRASASAWAVGCR